MPTQRASVRGSFPALDETAAAWQCGDPERAAEDVRALRAAGVTLPVALTPGAAPGDATGAQATITALDLSPRSIAKPGFAPS